MTRAARLLFLSVIIAVFALLLSSVLEVSAAAKRFDPSAPPPDPNPPSREVVLARNKRRFPKEWFPEGYDVGEPAVTGTASSEPKWISPAAKNSKLEKRIWFDPNNPRYRPPGKLLLNMLVMNEEAHLTRTLPAWAKITDYWIIGVDEKNTDNSEEIIKKYLGHLPGMIATVRGFDGHGPTWTTLVTLGIEYFPGATHGMISDADFRPMLTTLDRNELDIRCSKHMYTIWTADHRNERKMDWIYRNIPGARISRRTHQVVEVPIFQDQEVFQTLVNLPVDEQPGGYGDRSGNKEERYIKWMAADLLDFPDDPRALYYLGYGNWDLFNTHGSGPIQQKHRDALEQSIYYFNRRVDLPPAVGNKEERWFALLKLAEIHERFKSDWTKAEAYYQRAIKLDDERADPYFYIGQHYRLVGDNLQAEPWLAKASTLTVPTRSLFMWHYLYHCLSKLDYGRNFVAIQKPKIKLTKKSIQILRSGDCSQGDPGNQSELDKLLDSSRNTLKRLRKENKKRKAKLKKAKEEAEAAAAAEKRKSEEDEEPKAEKQKDDSDDSTSSSSSATTGPVDPYASVKRPSSEMTASEITAFLENDEKIGTVRKLVRFLLTKSDEVEKQVEKAAKDGAAASKDNEKKVNCYSDLNTAIVKLSQYVENFNSIKGKKKKAKAARAKYLSCKKFRVATSIYLSLFEREEKLLTDMINDSAKMEEWKNINQATRALCR